MCKWLDSNDSDRNLIASVVGFGSWIPKSENLQRKFEHLMSDGGEFPQTWCKNEEFKFKKRSTIVKSFSKN
jgi:hypothetical protein